MRRTTLLFAFAALAATSCSLQLDSQYGLRWNRRLPSPTQNSEHPFNLEETNTNEYHDAVTEVNPLSSTQIATLSASSIDLELNDERYQTDQIDALEMVLQPSTTKKVVDENFAHYTQRIATRETSRDSTQFGPEYYWGFKLLVFFAGIIAMIGAILLVIGWAISEYATLYGGILLGVGGLGLIALGIWWLLYS